VYVVATSARALGHTGVEFLHAVILKVAGRRNIEGLVNELLVIGGNCARFKPPRDINTIVRIEILAL